MSHPRKTTPTYKYQATPQFWSSFYRLPSSQKEAVREVWKVFKLDPFSPGLGTHKINSLSGRSGKVIYSVPIEANLRVVFHIIGDTVWSIDVGSHDLYA